MPEENNLDSPPQCLEAERAAIGSVLIEPALATELTSKLTEDDFWNPKCREVFKRIVSIEKNQGAITFVTVAHDLKNVDSADIIEMEEAVPHSGGFDSHVELIKQKSALRKLRWMMQESLARIPMVNGDFGDFATSLPKKLEEILDPAQSRSVIAIRTAVEEVMKSWIFTGIGGGGGLSSGLLELDTMIGGFEPGELVLVAGRPSMGKSAFLLSLFAKFCFEDGTPVGLFSLEMGRESLIQRLMSMRSRMDLLRLRRGFLTVEEKERLTNIGMELSLGRFFMEDRGGVSIGEFKALASRMVKRDGVKVIGVDYLQLMKGSSSKRNSESRVNEISEISAELKKVARDLNVVVFALSQLNRQADLREDKRPKLSDLRESGSLEQDADIVLLLYRPEYYKAFSGKTIPVEEEGLCEVEVAKQRNGPVGCARVGFAKEHGRFYNRGLERMTLEF